ncbi:serine hydrolase [Streptomyces sp. NPDC017936]|uniref:serine hydrolase n=1 Tax=Streptomyces sp. NPDC017936 TaxID=3365016 RepID=UPI0037A5B168
MTAHHATRPPHGKGHAPVPPAPSGPVRARLRRERIRMALASSAAGVLLTGCFAAGHGAPDDRDGRPPAQNRAPAATEDGKPARAAQGSPGARTPDAGDAGDVGGVGDATDATDANSVLARSLEPIRRKGGTRLSVAVLEPRTGRRAVSGSQTHITASLAKVNILVTLLLQAQREGRSLTSWETSTAASMIQSSDNASADALWRRIGRGAGLTEANKTLGLTSTQAGPGTHWGLTRTTAADQLTLLTAVFADNSPLSASSRRLIQTFMGRIDADQDWGVSAEGSRWQLKNGWLQRSVSQRWAINSMGRVKAHGDTYYLAVLSHGSPTMSHGISAVERAARSAVHALRGTPAPVPPIIG